jgi:sec-independent protein translocase protein TatB
VELVVILLLALIVFGPTHLPGLARNLGLWTGRLRGFLSHMKQQVERELAAEEMRKTVAMARESVASEIEPRG